MCTLYERPNIEYHYVYRPNPEIEGQRQLTVDQRTGWTLRIDEEGHLIGVKETVDFDSREAADVDSAKIHNELLIENARKAKEAANSIKEEDEEENLKMELQQVD